MGFREDWEVWHAQEREAFRQSVIRARESWQGRRVWVWASSWSEVSQGYIGRSDWQYGLVESIDEQGRVHVLYAWDQYERPVRCSLLLRDLGHYTVLAE